MLTISPCVTTNSTHVLTISTHGPNKFPIVIFVLTQKTHNLHSIFLIIKTMAQVGAIFVLLDSRTGPRLLTSSILALIQAVT